MSCEAVQHSDQKRCERCDLTWDMNDFDPPKCLTGRELCQRVADQIGREELMKVYVYPDGENYGKPPPWKSDDFETRNTALCRKCNTLLEVEHQRPFASCECGAREWTV